MEQKVKPESQKPGLKGGSSDGHQIWQQRDSKDLWEPGDCSSLSSPQIKKKTNLKKGNSWGDSCDEVT